MWIDLASWESLEMNVFTKDLEKPCQKPHDWDSAKGNC